MPRISKLIWEETTLDYGWMYDIQSIDGTNNQYTVTEQTVRKYQQP